MSPVTNTQLMTQKLTKHVKNRELEPMGRIRAARRLLKHTEHSARASKASRALARELLKAEQAEVRTAAGQLLEFLMTQRETDEDQNELDEIPETKIGAATYTDPFDGVTVDEILAEMNKDVTAEPVPAKFIYFPTGRPQYLKERYAELFANFTEDDIRQMQDSPYNTLLGISYSRVINPEFRRAYSYWLFRHFSHQMPGRESSWFLRFSREEDIRRYGELGTLVVPSEQPIGYELRRREHVSGFVPREEIPFAYCLFLQILSGNTSEAFVNFEDTPLMFVHEFDCVKTDEERKAERAAEVQNVSQ